MDDFFKTIKNKFTVEHVFSKDKEPVVNREEDIRRTLGKIDPNDIVDADEIVAKLNEIHQKSKTALDELKVESTSIIGSAKSQSSQIIDSAKTSFGVLQKPQPPEPEVQVKEEEDDPYTADDSKVNSNVIVIELNSNEKNINETDDVIKKLDNLEAESLNALDELMTKSNKIIESAEDQSNKIIDSAKTNLNILQQKISNESVKQDENIESVKISNESVKQDENIDTINTDSDTKDEQLVQKPSNRNVSQEPCDIKDKMLNLC